MVERSESQSQSTEFPNEPIDLDIVGPDSPENDDSLPLEDLEDGDALPLDELDDLLGEEDQLLTGEDIDEAPGSATAARYCLFPLGISVSGLH